MKIRTYTLHHVYVYGLDDLRQRVRRNCIFPVLSSLRLATFRNHILQLMHSTVTSFVMNIAECCLNTTSRMFTSPMFHIYHVRLLVLTTVCGFTTRHTKTRANTSTTRLFTSSVYYIFHFRLLVRDAKPSSTTWQIEIVTQTFTARLFASSIFLHLPSLPICGNRSESEDFQGNRNRRFSYIRRGAYRV